METSPGPTQSSLEGLLQGVRVLDLSRVMSGPFCTAMLADLGADVIKIELPGIGEDSRRFGPYHDGESAYFLLLNRGKRSVTLNLKSDRGIEILQSLAATSDVIVENFRPGVATRLGIGYEALRDVNPAIIYASISGFGGTGPFADRPAYDPIVQAMSGLMDMTGSPEGPPTLVGESVADVCTGMFAGWGIMTALFARERDGKGRHVEIAMLDSVFSMLLTALSIQLYGNRTPRRVGNRHPVTYPVDTFPARDGHVVMVVTTDKAFSALCNVMSRPSLASDSRFLTNHDRDTHASELRELITSWTRAHTAADIVKSLDGAGIPSAPVLSVAAVAESAHTTFRELISSVVHPRLGPIPVVHQPVRFSGAGRGTAGAPPLLGEHTHEVLTSLLGLDKTEIEKLTQDQII